jgi:hypothetical protein
MVQPHESAIRVGIIGTDDATVNGSLLSHDKVGAGHSIHSSQEACRQEKKSFHCYLLILSYSINAAKVRKKNETTIFWQSHFLRRLISVAMHITITHHYCPITQGYPTITAGYLLIMKVIIVYILSAFWHQIGHLPTQFL